jgi:hypothetical protein
MALKKAKQVLFDPESIFSGAVKKERKELLEKDGKILDVISFSENLLKVYPYRAQEIILKFLYGGTKFNEDLDITEDDLKIIESWEIPNTWLTHGENSKINILKKNKEQFKKDPRNNFFRDIVLIIGRRAGKSFLSSLIAVYEAYKLISLKDPHAYYSDGKRKFTGDIWIVNTAVTEKQAKTIIFSYIKDFIYKCPVFEGRIGHETDDMIYLLTDADIKNNEKIKKMGGKSKQGSVVLACGNSNSPALRGHSTVACIYDEMAHYVDSSGKASAEEVYTAIEPSTSTFYKYGDGRNIVISSPDLPSGFFYDHYQSAKTVNTMLLFQIPTWDANSDHTKESLKDKFDKNFDRAMAEYGAHFRRSGGNVYIPHVMIDEAITRRDSWYKQKVGNSGIQYYLHIDPAKNSDRWAVMIGHMERRFDSENRIFLEHAVEDFSQTFKAESGKVLDPDEIMDDFVIPLFTKFKIVSVTSDQMFSLEQQKKLKRKGIHFREMSYNGVMKNKIYETMKDFFITGRIDLCNDDQELQGELKNITQKQTAHGFKIENNPDDKDYPYDDLVDCLGGVIFSMCQGAAGLTQLPKTMLVRTGFR